MREVLSTPFFGTDTFGHQQESVPISLNGKVELENKAFPLTYRTFSPYFWVAGGTIPFIRRYSTSCP